MTQAARSAIDVAATGAGVLVSTVTAWEIGLLVSKGKVTLDLPPWAWFQRFIALPGLRLANLSAQAALLSSFLPEPFHGDPADRMLVAIARELQAILVTRDRKILAYAEAGHVRALSC